MIEVLLVSEELMISGYAETDTCWIMLGIYDANIRYNRMRPGPMILGLAIAKGLGWESVVEPLQPEYFVQAPFFEYFHDGRWWFFETQVAIKWKKRKYQTHIDPHHKMACWPDWDFLKMGVRPNHPILAKCGTFSYWNSHGCFKKAPLRNR